jgi:hypothetical protein
MEDYSKYPNTVERLTAWRRDHPLAEKHPYYRATPAEQADLDLIVDPRDKLTAYRAMAERAAQAPAAASAGGPGRE